MHRFDKRPRLPFTASLYLILEDCQLVYDENGILSTRTFPGDVS